MSMQIGKLVAARRAARAEAAMVDVVRAKKARTTASAALAALLLVPSASGGAAVRHPEPIQRPVQDTVQVASPDGRNVVTVGTTEGRLIYAVERDGRKIILPSRLGFEFRDAGPLRDSLRLEETGRNSVDETWEQPWGEVARVRDHHNELRVTVTETREPARRFDVVFRAFDDGIGFRYELPEQPHLGSFAITEELTEFHPANDARAWWIEADDVTHRYELLYSSSPVSTLPTVHTPLTMETQDGVFVVLHEANLVDYAGMNLSGSRDRRLRVSLTAWADGVKVYGETPFVTPWRTIQLADRVEDLVP
ncbi:MAG: glycoside hydrolase family 97 N-terminal domain-containing protein, partial [Gemmatimonadota bacterium]